MAVDLSRLNHLSCFEGLSPEQAVCVAVIVQALHDLESKDEVARFEAHEFFLQKSGAWADMRRFYFQAIQIDEQVVHEALKQRLDPPERPEKKWTAQEIAQIIPHTRTFTAKEIQHVTGLSNTQTGSRLQVLTKANEVARIAPGTYCHISFVAAYHANREKEAQLKEQARLAEIDDILATWA